MPQRVPLTHQRRTIPNNKRAVILGRTVADQTLFLGFRDSTQTRVNRTCGHNGLLEMLFGIRFN